MWTVKTKAGTNTLTALELIHILSSKIIEQEKEDQKLLSKTLIRFLEDNNTLGDLSTQELTYLTISLGYLYRVFKEVNEVEFHEEELESDNQTNTESGN